MVLGGLRYPKVSGLFWSAIEPPAFDFRQVIPLAAGPDQPVKNRVFSVFLAFR